MSEIQNAKITSTHLGNEDHAIFTCYLHLDYGGSGQSFGGYGMDVWKDAEKRRVGTAFGLDFIKEILRVLEVDRWEKLPGTYCRVRATHTRVDEIGHLLKDVWFNPQVLAQKHGLL